MADQRGNDPFWNNNLIENSRTLEREGEATAQESRWSRRSRSPIIWCKDRRTCGPGKGPLRRGPHTRSSAVGSQDEEEQRMGRRHKTRAGNSSPDSPRNLLRPMAGCPGPGQDALPTAPQAICSRAVTRPQAPQQSASSPPHTPQSRLREAAGGRGLQLPACPAPGLPGAEGGGAARGKWGPRWVPASPGDPGRAPEPCRACVAQRPPGQESTVGSRSPSWPVFHRPGGRALAPPPTRRPPRLAAPLGPRGSGAAWRGRPGLAPGCGSRARGCRPAPLRRPARAGVGTAIPTPFPGPGAGGWGAWGLGRRT